MSLSVNNVLIALLTANIAGLLPPDLIVEPQDSLTVELIGTAPVVVVDSPLVISYEEK